MLVSARALFLLVTLFVCSCGQPSAPVTSSEAPKSQGDPQTPAQPAPVAAKATSAPQPTQPDPVPQSRDADDVARFVAGMPGTEGSPFAELEATPAWQEHRRLLDAAWAHTQSTMLTQLRAFQQAELNDTALRTAPVYYPFGGPDSLTMTTYFPHSPSYAMVALEPAGTLPAVSQFEKKDVAKYLAEIRETVADILGRSFFITKQMDKQFRGQVTDGLVLPILHLLVRTDKTILGFRYVRLDEQGRIVDRDKNYTATTRYGNKGFEIQFRSASDPMIHTLVYFSVNLADDRLAENKPFLTYMAGLKGSTTMLKATSYMPHHKEFGLIRDQMLAVSGAILQDDSGIEYKYFVTPQWKVQLYGDYQKPYGSFAYMEQPDLRKAYETSAKALNARVGYGYSKVASNLLLARKTDAPASAAH